MPTAHIPHTTHTTRLPRFLTAAATTAAALAATAPFAAANETWTSSDTINSSRFVDGTLSIDNNAPGPVIDVVASGELSATKIQVGVVNNKKGALNIIGGGKAIAAEVSIGTASGSIGDVTISGKDSYLSVTGNLISSYAGTGTLDISAGATVVNTGSTVIGYSGNGNGSVSVRGIGTTLSITEDLNIAPGAIGKFDVSSGGKVTSAYVRMATEATGNATLNLDTGGTLETGYITKGQGNATVNLNGGTINASGDQANFFRGIGHLTLSDANHPAGTPALIFNTNGYNVISSDGASTVFDGASGFTKTGAGTLTLTGTHTYTGTTTVAGGITSILKITDALNGGTHHPGDIVLVGGSSILFSPTEKQEFSGVLSGTGAIGFVSAQSVVIAGTLNPGAGTTPGELKFSNTTNVSFSTGAQFVVDLAVLADGGNDLLVIEGGKLVLDGAQLVLQRGKNFPLWSALGGAEIVIAHVESGGQIEGMFANVDEKKFVTDTAGRRLLVSIRANGDGGQDLLLTMFPEPSTYALLGGTGALLLALFRKRRQRKVATKAAK
jgi:T5SS/PEP-CTERM-associated repeat protein/autotransporter-associated beta strand protein